MRGKKWFKQQKREVARTRQLEATEVNLDSERGPTILVDPIVAFIESLEAAADLPSLYFQLLARWISPLKCSLVHLHKFKVKAFILCYPKLYALLYTLL